DVDRTRASGLPGRAAGRLPASGRYCFRLDPAAEYDGQGPAARAAGSPGRSLSHGSSKMVDLAWVSLAALVVVIGLSCTTAVNPGFLSLALAWVVGIYLAPAWGRSFTIGEVLSGFPTDLFLTLVGVTLLFTLARGNGTLDRVVRVAVRGCRGNAGLIPVLFFALACAIASIGAGNIATAALIGPLAMAVAE